MKKIIIALLVLFASFGCSKDEAQENVVPVPPVVYKSVQKRLNENETPMSIYKSGISIDSLYGKTYKGGLIYYFEINKGTGLVAHFQDNSGDVDWGGLGNVINANSIEIGSGQLNSNAIMDYYLIKNTAADFCDTLILNGFDDWFLPSKNEMIMMMSKLKNKQNVYFGAVSGYWTSSNYDFEKVWIVNQNNVAIVNFKTETYNYTDIRIRATRKF